MLVNTGHVNQHSTTLTASPPLEVSLYLAIMSSPVCFMVSMGSSLADRAWGRESAVYRITGVMAVISGWFITALGGFLIALAVTALLLWGGWIAVAALTALCAWLLVRSHLKTPGLKEEAEKALLPVIPSVDEFPYAIRVVSEVVSSNGSTSQGSICGSTLALMDAGVPIKRPVAGISCGLISDKETGTWRTFTDIQGVEDFHGEMDFKVAGTTEGVTAIQMDLKNDGLTMEIIADALERCRKARLEILNEIMIPCIAKPRDHVSEFAPKMLTMKIDVDKIREVIGKGGSMIQKIVAESGAQVDIDDDGTIHIASPDAASCDAAKKMIDDICFVPEVGKLYYGKVVRILPIGAFVELAPGKDGMIHISKLENRRVEKVEDVLNIGDMTWVKVTEIDEKGRVNLSRKDALKELAAAADKK